jgi:hypothetical protein
VQLERFKDDKKADGRIEKSREGILILTQQKYGNRLAPGYVESR